MNEDDNCPKCGEVFISDKTISKPVGEYRVDIFYDIANLVKHVHRHQIWDSRVICKNGHEFVVNHGVKCSECDFVPIKTTMTEIAND